MATAEEGQSLIILGAAPGTETYGKLELSGARRTESQRLSHPRRNQQGAHHGRFL